jgi:hypothetical protein
VPTTVVKKQVVQKKCNGQGLNQCWFSHELHMVPLGHIPSLRYHCSCIAQEFSILRLSLSLSPALSLTIPDIPGNYFCTNTPRKEKRTQTDAPKGQQTQTDGYPHQNGR